MWRRLCGGRRARQAAHDSCTCSALGEQEAAQQEDAKKGTGHGDVIPWGRDIEDTGSERPGLGSSSRDAGVIKKVHLIRALIASVGDEPLPAFEGPAVPGGFTEGSGWGARYRYRGRWRARTAAAAYGKAP